MYLPAFMLVATWLIVFWKQFRKVTRITEKSTVTEKIVEYKRLKRVSVLFWLIFSAFGVMTLIYSLTPEFYIVFCHLTSFTTH
jgi:hypothetical protein